MGTWDELDIEITVDVDTTDLDKFSNLDSQLFGEIISKAETIKKAFEDGSKRGVSEIAKRTKSIQEQALEDTGRHPYSRGRLSSSIQSEERDEYTFVVGTTIAHFYPLAVEKGRVEVRPIKARALHWVMPSGEEVFAMKSKATDGTPFVEPTYNFMSGVSQQLMELEVAQAVQKVI